MSTIFRLTTSLFLVFIIWIIIIIIITTLF